MRIIKYIYTFLLLLFLHIVMSPIYLYRLIRMYRPIKSHDKNISKDYKGIVKLYPSKDIAFTYKRGRKINFFKFLYYYFGGLSDS